MWGFGIFLIIAAFIAGVGILVFGMGRGKEGAALGVFVLLFGVGVIFLSVIQVPVGNVGVVLRFGATTGDIKMPGLNSKSPVDKIELMNIQTQKFEAEAGAASRDLQDVATTVAINYKLEAKNAVEVYRTLGQGYIEKIAHPAIQEIVKEITAKYDAGDLILKRSEVKEAISKTLLARLTERGITTEIVNITNFQFSEVFTKSIESKVAAVQSAMEAENKLVQVKVEAQQAEARAIGMANAAIAEATGQAKAITIVTEAQLAANQKLAASLTPEVLQYIFIDRLGKDIKVVVIPQGQQFVLPSLTGTETGK